MNSKKCAIELAQELSVQFASANQNLLCGGLSNQISNEKYSQIPVDTICQQYELLLPKIENLCKTFRAEIVAGRAKEKNGN